MATREERLAENEALFREVNEQISEVGTHFGSQNLSLVCECATLVCTERFELSRTDYSRLRSSRIQFAVVPGHELPKIETVVEKHDAYFVVEKIGEGAAVAEQRHESV